MRSKKKIPEKYADINRLLKKDSKNTKIHIKHLKGVSEEEESEFGPNRSNASWKSWKQSMASRPTSFPRKNQGQNINLKVRSDSWSSPAANEQEKAAREQRRAAESQRQAKQERVKAEIKERYAKSEEFKAAREEVKRERELGGMNWWDKAKGKTKDTVSDSKLGKAVQGMGKGMQGLKSLHSDVKNGASKVAGGFADVLFKIIKGVFWGLLIVGILFAAAVMLYSAESENCVEFRTPGLQGYSAIFTDFQNYEFTKCVFANLFSNVEIAIQKIDVVDHILNFMDQQVYRATGDYYYANVDDNVEPVGVFIENLKKKSRYYTDEMVSISADIKVKTLGSKVVGKVTCDLEGIPYDQIVPSTGNFSADKDQSTKVVCGWLPYKFKKTDNSKDFEMLTQFGYETFAYMAPSIIKQTVWDNLTEEQRSKIETKADENLLRTNKAPVQIGGVLGSEDNKIIVVDDYFMVDSDKELPLGITFHTDTQSTTWDEGSVKEIKKVVITVPSSVEMKEDMGTAEDSNLYCFGYTFNEGSCNDLNSYLGESSSTTPGNDNYEYLCNNDEIVYMLDQSGTKQKLRNIDNFKTLQCTLVSTVNELFPTEESMDLGFNQIGIKVYASYTYEVSKTSSINIVKRYNEDYEELKTYTCSGSTKTDAENGQGITQSIRDEYAKTFQTKFRRYLPSGSDMEKVRMEAMMAAISIKYSGMVVDSSDSGNDDDDDGIIDYLTGCTAKTGFDDDYDKELKCLANALESHLLAQKKDVAKTMSAYYSEKGDTYSESQHAQIQDYYNWLGVLCKETTMTTATPTATIATPTVTSS